MTVYFHAPASSLLRAWLNSALWAEDLNLGAYDVLVQPFDPDEVYRVILLAWDNASAPQRARAADSLCT